MSFRGSSGITAIGLGLMGAARIPRIRRRRSTVPYTEKRHMIIQFNVDGPPCPQPRQRHRIAGSFGKAFVQNYTPKNDPVNVYKGLVRAEASKVFRGAPLTGSLFVLLVFVMPRPKRLCWKNKEMPRLHHATKPDLDNLAKAVMDALSGVAWVDDAQVCELILSKFIAAGDEKPHTEVAIVRYAN